jgi:hypothetical protein
MNYVCKTIKATTAAAATTTTTTTTTVAKLFFYQSLQMRCTYSHIAF